MPNKHWPIMAFLILMLLALAACGGVTQTTAPATALSVGVSTISPTNPPPSPTAVPPTNTATAVAPTTTPHPTNTSEPTIEPAVTEAVIKIADATATAVPTVESNPTQLPDGWYGPQNFTADMNPLTGEIVDDPSVLQRRPLAIKISNFPPLVRPQRGLNNADIVYEHLAEGGATRFTAVFYSKDSFQVGSVRSARIIDFEVPVMYDAALGFSGAAGGNKDRFATVDWFDRIISPDFGHGGYYRDFTEHSEDGDDGGEEGVDFWHTMFTDTERLRFILQERGLDTAPELQNGMIFSEAPPEGGTEAGEVEIRYTGNDAFWWYDSGLGRYVRWTDGDRHLDANYDEQINFKNIVVVSAQHVDSWIVETEVGQGANSIEVQIWGEGPVSIFRDGQRFDGRWVRNDPKDMLTFYDEDDNPIPLAPGNIWFQLVPLGFEKLIVNP